MKVFLPIIKLKNIKTSATCNKTRVIHQLTNSCSVADTCGRCVADTLSATRYIIKEKALIPLCKAKAPTSVSIHRNSSIHAQKLRFPSLGTRVSCLGTGVSTQGTANSQIDTDGMTGAACLQCCRYLGICNHPTRYLQRCNNLLINILSPFCCRWQMFCAFYGSSSNLVVLLLL